MHLLKKTIIYFFLLAFLFQALVFNLCLYTFTVLAKFEENNTKTQQLNFTAQQYASLKLNRSEFLYNNNLYDIISSKTENGTIKLFCKVDTKEKDLLEKLIEGFKESKAKKQISFSFLAELGKPINLKTQPLQNGSIKHIAIISDILKCSTNRTTPPPKV